jgi:RNA polymerase sigma-70 factor (ECF subfamily)
MAYGFADAGQFPGTAAFAASTACRSLSTRPRPAGGLSPDTDEALMARVGQGDRAAFQHLVNRHLGTGTALAQRVLLNRADADEVVQEAFLRVWTTAPRWRPEGALFRTWFSRVLVNLCIDRKRKPRAEPLEAAGDPPDPARSAEQRLAEREEAAAIAAAVAELPERQRAALALCYWQEMSNIEAAAALSLSVGAVESLLVRARRALRLRLAGRIGTGREGVG